MKVFPIKYFILLFVAILLVTMFSACSPLYPVNPWSDPNWYITIGKGLINGLMPYRDLWDQKGPSLFILQGLMALISDTSLLGAYLIEILALWIGMIYSYKTMRLFSDSPICLPLTCVLATTALTSDFYYWGETVEELCLPIICHSSYVLLKYAKRDELPGTADSMTAGIGMGFIFWCKFTILTFHIGALAAILSIAYRREKLRSALMVIGKIAAGFAATCLFIIVFYLSIGAFYDMIDAYFITNLFRYGEDRGNQVEPIFLATRIIGWVFIVALPWRMKINKDVKTAVLLPWSVTMTFFTFAKIDCYYFVIIFYALPYCIHFFRRIAPSWKINSAFALYCISVSALNYNFCTLITGQLPDTVLHMAEIVNNDPDHPKELLQYNSFATAIYLKTDCHSPIKFFSAPLSKVDYRPMQDEYLASCKSKYVIHKIHRYLNNDHDMDENNDYELIYETKEKYRYLFLENPLAFLWSLGYTQPIMKHFYQPAAGLYDRNRILYRLYRLKKTDQHG